MNTFIRDKSWYQNKLLIISFLFSLIGIINVNVFHIFKSYALYFNLILVCALLFLQKSLLKSHVIYILGVVTYFLFSLFITKGGVGSVITFSTPFLMLLCFSNIDLDEISEKILRWIGLIFVIYEFYYSKRYIGNRFAILNDINPNTVAMFSMFGFMLYVSLLDNKVKFYYLRIAILLGLSIITMFNCEARGTTVATLLFSLLSVINIRFIKPKFYCIISILIIILGTIFPFFYLYLYQNNYEFEMFGKSLYTGRESIWLLMTERFNESFVVTLFGLGSVAELYQNHELNVHNNFFSVIVNFGVIGYILYYFYLYGFIKKAALNINSCKVSKLIAMFISSILFLGFTETTSFWSAIYNFAFISIGLAVSISRNESREEVEHE